MDAAEGFIFGPVNPYRPVDLERRKDTPPPHPKGELATKKDIIGFGRSQVNIWSKNNSEHHAIAIADGEPLELRNFTGQAPDDLIANSSHALTLAPESQDRMHQESDTVAEQPKAMNRGVVEDCILTCGLKGYSPMKGLFAKSKINQRSIEEHEKAAEVARTAQRNASSAILDNQPTEDVLPTSHRDIEQHDISAVPRRHANIEDEIPDSLDVAVHMDPIDLADSALYLGLMSHPTEPPLQEGVQGEYDLDPRSNNSSPFASQGLHQADERRVELLTQVGRRACHDKGEEDTRAPPTEEHAGADPASSQAVLTRCKSKANVNDEILHNLGSKRSRPRRASLTVAAAEPPALDSIGLSDPTPTPVQENVGSTDVATSPACPTTTLPAAIGITTTESITPNLNKNYRLTKDLPNRPTASVTLDLNSGRTTIPRFQRSPLAARLFGLPDNRSRSTTERSPLSKFNESFEAKRRDAAILPGKSLGRTLDKRPEGQDDMYITFGLMIKAKEREELLEEKSQHCYRLEVDLKKLRYELNGTQKALEVQASILQRARAEDSKRVREQKARCQHLELQISRYKKQIEATSKISADYQRRYLLDIAEAKETVQQEYETRLRTGLTDAEAELKARFLEQLEAKDKEIREVTDCINQSKTEAKLRTQDLMSCREEIQDAIKLCIEKDFGQQDLLNRNAKLETDLKNASSNIDDSTDRIQTLCDERSQLHGQLECLREQLAARDLSLAELNQIRNKSEELRIQLSASITALELQGATLVQREKDYHELSAKHQSLTNKAAVQSNTINSLETRLAQMALERDTGFVSQAKLEQEIKTVLGRLEQSQSGERDLQRKFNDLNKEKQSLAIALTKKTTEWNDLKLQYERQEVELSSLNSRLDKFLKELCGKEDQSRKALNTLTAKVDSETQDRLRKSQAGSEKVVKENTDLVQRCQDLEKAKAVAEVQLQCEVDRCANLQQALQLAKNDRIAHDKQLASNAAKVTELGGRLQAETAKLERADDRTRQLEETVTQLQADVQTCRLLDEGLITRYQDDNLRPMELRLLQLAVNETAEELNNKRKQERIKHEATARAQLAQIAELKKENAQKQAQLRTATQNLAQAATVNKTRRTLIPSDGWEQSSETGRNSSHPEAEPETLGQDGDANEEDELSGSQTIVGTQPARPTQMPRRLRAVANLPNAGQRLAKESVFNATIAVHAQEMVIEQESESMETDVIGTFASTTQRPKFSTLVRDDPDSSPTARARERIGFPEQVDELDHAPSQDPIESSEDEDSDAGGADMLWSRSIPVAPNKPSIPLSKTRGQKRQAEALEAPMISHHVQLSRQESVASTQDVYAKPVTKKNTVGYGKKAKRDRK